MLDKIERVVLKGLNKGYASLHKANSFLTIKEGKALNDYIRESLLSDKPFMCGRLGTEFFATAYPYSLTQSRFTRRKEFVKGYLRVYDNDEMYAQHLVDIFCQNCGFFPNKPELLSRYSMLTLDDLKDVDLLGVFFNREELFLEYVTAAQKCRLEMLEPYDYANPWSSAFEGKKVLIIHPFAESIKSQYSRRELLWEDKNVLPDFELKTIKAVQSIAGEKVPFDTWFEALDHMKGEMDGIDYDIAIIGCGAYGFHLAAHAKRCGKKAIHLGGATQILFGIKGKRWDELPCISKFYNDNWVYPSLEETPRNCNVVEKGCYW